MDKSYTIKLDEKLIGATKLEKADPPMGVVFGKITLLNSIFNYQFIKAYRKNNGIELAFDEPEDKLISTKTIEKLKVVSPEGLEIKSIGNQILGMDSEGYEIILEGIPFPFYEKEFPHHVKGYE